MLGGGVTSLHMLIGDSADGQKTCICTGVSRANVGGQLGGGSDEKEAVLGGWVTSLHMLLGDSADWWTTPRTGLRVLSYFSEATHP